MKQVKMILKAQEAYFQLRNSTQLRYEVDMTNDRHQDGTPKVGCPGHPYYLCGHRSSCQLRICAVLSCGVQSAPPELSESSLLASFGSDEHLNYPKPYVQGSGGLSTRVREVTNQRIHKRLILRTIIIIRQIPAKKLFFLDKE